MSQLTTFNNLLNSFFTYLRREFPELTDVAVTQNSVELLKSINPRMVLDQFMYYFFPYFKEIYNKKEDFFLNIKNLSNHNYFEKHMDKKQYFMDKFIKILDIWKTTSDIQKDRIWKFIQALLKIGAVASKNQDHKQILDYISNNPNLFA